VIEASEKSGSLITAAWALGQGRDVMAVPGNVLTGRNRGGHALIRDGATIVETADDIVEELGLTGMPSPVIDGQTATARDGNRASKAATCADTLLRAMESGHVYDLDGLSHVSGLDSVRLLPRLLELELHGRVRRVGGGRFMRCS
jgi:DNA processing protein